MKNLAIVCALLFTMASNAQEIKFGKVSKQELEEKFYPLDSTADAAYILKEKRTYYTYVSNSGWHVITDYHERIKIYNQDGFKYATKKITYYKPESGKPEKVTTLKAYTFNLEGNKVVKNKLSKKSVFIEKLNKYRNQKKITFPNIKKGSVIDLKYSVSSPYYWNIDDLNFQYSIPVKQLQYKVEIPEFFIFNTTSKGSFNITPNEKTIERIITLTATSRTDGIGMITSKVNASNMKYQANVYTYLGKNITPLNENEPYTGNLNNYKGGVAYELSGTDFSKIGGRIKNYTKTWEQVCKSIFQSSNFGREINKTNYYSKDLNQVLVPAKSDSDKVALIFQYVKSKVKWNGYNSKYVDKGVRKAYKEGTGNSAEINLMLTSMLRSAGINANPVLVSTKDNGIPLFPTIEGFNYVITKVNFSDDKYILIDATSPFASPNILPFKTLNWYGREIFDTAYSQSVNLIPATHSKENNVLHVKIDEFGNVNGMLRKSLTGHSAMFYRENYNSKKNEDIITSIEEKNNIEIDGFKINNKEKIIKPINETFKFTGEGLIEEINNKLYFSPMLFLVTDENPFKSKERNFPVDFGMPWKDQFSVTIAIPENYTVESYPKELAIGLPEQLGLFKYKLVVQGNKIKLSSVTQFNTSIIAPHYYDVLKDFYKQLVKKQGEKIVLAKK